jgi:hypothetical protein
LHNKAEMSIVNYFIMNTLFYFDLIKEKFL